MHVLLNPSQLEELKSFDTCTLADAIESFGVRLRNEGFAVGGFRCLFKNLPPTVGYAATCSIRSADPPMVGKRYEERTDWWTHVLDVPAPRVVALQDIDQPPGTGAFFGEVHANVLTALGCVGAITNGAARELPGVEASGFQIFAGRLAVSRAYIHIVEYGRPITFGRLPVSPADLIHGDRHGVLIIPPEVAPELARVARAIRKKKRSLIDLSRRPEVTAEELARELKHLMSVCTDFDRDGENRGNDEPTQTEEQ